MSGRKNKNRHRRPAPAARGRDRGQSTELLDELNSLRDLLGSDELGDIPLLDRVAEPAPDAPPPRRQPGQPPERRPQPPAQEPLDESDLPILFSPVDEELPEDCKPELDEADRALLRPLQELPTNADATDAGAGSHPEQQGELFSESGEQPPTVAENPFLPAHIRSRLTGGRRPEPETESVAAAEGEPGPAPQEGESQPAEPPPPASEALPANTGETAAAADTAATERERQRQQLIDRLVAQQLPSLERQLRARIERMVDELERKRQ